ncbi:hypothetical protein LUZ60_001786 [Juncus effusus]|nr:hypothetical protein LUZ60_001786 [Juncus effusus]
MEAEHHPLLGESEPLIGFVDYRGRPVHRSSSGGWPSGLFLLGLELATRFAYYGVSSNLITYLTGPLGRSNAEAAAATNAWSGFAYVMPLVGAALADSWLGRFRAIILATVLYILGFGMLSLSAMLPFLKPSDCSSSNPNSSSTCVPSAFQLAFFFVSLYLVAIAQGFDKPCSLAFGADQFDQDDLIECASRSSFFNWWYFAMSMGITISVLVLSYIQDNVGWGLGFGMPCIIMILALILFLIGTKTYRFYVMEKDSPFVRIGKTFFYLATSRWRNKNRTPTTMELDQESQPDKSLTKIEEIEEAKSILRLLPIWATSLVYGMVFAQLTTFFTKTTRTLNRHLSSSLLVPPAALQSFGTIAIIVFIPIYDRIIVPIARKISKNPRGITMLQRVGGGMAISLACMVVSALVEMKRLETAREYGLIDQPDSTIPMSLWWVVPQYVLIGMADVFTVVGLQEFFYDQIPDSLRSLGLALYASIIGVGAYLSSILISVLDKITSRNGESWFSNNLNKAHLDYFYWLLAGLSALELGLFIYISQGFVYKKKFNVL